MPAAARLSQFFKQKGIDCQLHHHDRAASLQAAITAINVAPKSVIRATLLIDVKGVVMAVYGLQASLDLGAVNRVLHRRLQPLANHQADRLFGDCDPGEHPPIGGAYGLPVVVDSSLLSAERLYMASGCRSTLVELDGRSFRLAMAGSARGAIAVHLDDDAQPQRQVELTLDDVARKLQRLYRLPPMPAVALHILKTTGDPDASARDLSGLIEHDPSLSAQVMRYARSALFNYQGQIDSVQDAITRVLGFERVAHLAMGLAASRAFQVPREGALGLDAFWRHSLHCAYLSQCIADRAATKEKPMDRGLAYLCGLLHNFGLLLIAHLFPPEFHLLNKLREANPEQPLALLEKQVFGMGGAQDLIAVGHGAIGGILAKLWELPETVVRAAGMHQLPAYDGADATYVNAVQLANALLKKQGIGDEFDEQDITPYMSKLGLDESALEALVKASEDASAELDALVGSLLD